MHFKKLMSWQASKAEGASTTTTNINDFLHKMEFCAGNVKQKRDQTLISPRVLFFSACNNKSRVLPEKMESSKAS